VYPAPVIIYTYNSFSIKCKPIFRLSILLRVLPKYKSKVRQISRSLIRNTELISRFNIEHVA